jgi:hypothetical protein
LVVVMIINFCWFLLDEVSFLSETKKLSLLFFES